MKWKFSTIDTLVFILMVVLVIWGLCDRGNRKDPFRVDLLEWPPLPLPEPRSQEVKVEEDVEEDDNMIQKYQRFILRAR